jgi:hypothetical protein
MPTGFYIPETQGNLSYENSPEKNLKKEVLIHVRLQNQTQNSQLGSRIPLIDSLGLVV